MSVNDLCSLGGGGCVLNAFYTDKPTQINTKTWYFASFIYSLLDCHYL